MRPELRLLYQGINTKRFHTVPTIQTETVGHHSHTVASLLVLLYPNTSKNAIVYCLFHDLAEFDTGDIPSPTKRLLGGEFKAAVDKVESDVFRDHGIKPPELTAEEMYTVKVCDVLAGLMRCHYELKMGNKHVLIAFNNFASYFRQLRCANLMAQELYDSLMSA